MVLDQKYLNMKNQVIKAERRVLKELGFCVHVKHPHKMIVTYLQVLECERNAQLVQTAWNYMNDSLRTDVFVKHMPETIACACIYLSARQLNVILPNNPPWYGLLGTDEDEIQEISLTILRLYARPKKSYEELDKVVERCRLAMQEAKYAKLKGHTLDVNSTAGTPNNFSPHSSRQASPKVNADSPGLPSSYNPYRVKEEPASGGSAQSSHKERNGKVARRSKTSASNSRSHSKSPRRGGRGRSRSHSSHSRSSSRSPSHSPSHNDKHYSSSHAGKHKKKDDHKRSRRDREREREHARERDRKYAKSSKSRSRKRKHSRSSSRDSRSRSRSRSPIRREKYDYKDSPGRDSGGKSKEKHRRQRSHSRERSRKGGKRDSGGHSRSRDRRRR
ncbi:cyclin-L1-like isoform X2 [Patiria miniata]|nr:cyclin-L1-like isoform X2 [Patiria miniata]